MVAANIGISAKLADFAACWPAERISAQTLKAAKRCLLDGLGVMLAASGLSDDIPPFADTARALGRGEATVLGFNSQVSAPAAAFANGAMAHALDFEDSFDAAPSHPNASLLPAVLAVIETGGPCSGLELLAAIAIGCDLACRLALSPTQPLDGRGWYPPPLFGLFGATAAVGRLLGLDPRQMLDAWSFALCQAGGPGEIKHAGETVLRAVREAFPAQAAVTAGLLAKRNVRGFDAPFEGEGGFFRLYAGGEYDPASLLEALGERFYIEELSFKPWPACRGTHAFIEAARDIMTQHGRPAETIEEIRLSGGMAHRMLLEPIERKRNPKTVIDAKFSLPFTVATTFCFGDVTLESFTPERLADARLHALAGKISYEIDPQWGYDRAASGAVQVRYADGFTCSAHVGLALGHPRHPMSDAALAEKFTDCVGHARGGWTQASARKFAEAIDRIEEVADVRKVLAMLKGSDRR